MVIRPPRAGKAGPKSACLADDSKSIHFHEVRIFSTSEAVELLGVAAPKIMYWYPRCRARIISWGWSSLDEVEQVTKAAFSPSRVLGVTVPLCSLAKYLASSSADGESGCAPST